MPFSVRQIIYQTNQDSHNIQSAAFCFLPREASLNKPKPLQEKCKPSQKLNHKLQDCLEERVSACASFQEKAVCGEEGSMTAEAALVMTLFLLASYVLFSLFFLIEFQVELQFSLEKAAREAAILCLNEQEGRSRIRAAVLEEMEDKTDLMDFGGTDAVFSVYKKGEYLEAAVTYQAGPVFHLFGSLQGIWTQTCARRLWSGERYISGADSEEGEEESVYVTQNGSVYHRQRSCTYLTLSVRTAAFSELEELRSSDGSRYRPCGKCAGKGAAPGLVYLTEDGTKYHGSRGCSGLCRWIIRIPFSEAGERLPCSRCGGG